MSDAQAHIFMGDSNPKHQNQVQQGGLLIRVLYPRVIKHGNGNGPSTNDFPNETSIHRGFSIAMSDYPRVTSIEPSSNFWFLFSLLKDVDVSKANWYNIVMENQCANSFAGDCPAHF